jgi:hypothetical protein
LTSARSCGHFATDATHLTELRQQLAATETIAQRREQYRQRSRRELGEDNIWIRHEITSLQAIIERLGTGRVPRRRSSVTITHPRSPTIGIQSVSAIPLGSDSSTGARTACLHAERQVLTVSFGIVST